MPEPVVPRYALLSDAPPLKENAHGCHVLAWNWVKAVGTDLKLVVTRRLSRSVASDQIIHDLSVPVVLYPDLAIASVPQRAQFLKSLFEVFLFVLWWPRIGRAFQTSGADRIFALFGGNAWFLWVAWWTSRWSRLPLDIYLVDDLEESARLAGSRWLAGMARWLEPKVLSRASRVFAISPGFCEHLQMKYGIRARWLPIPIPQDQIPYRPYQPATPDVREIVFLGAVNPLYLESIKELLHAIEQWNGATHSYRLRLGLLTYSDPAWLNRELGGLSNVEILFRWSDEKVRERLGASWAVFLPYAFGADQRVMVSTSFPSKLSESLRAGRPLLVYGPAQGSLPRYFRENDLPVCATLPAELMAALQNLERHDTVRLVERYQAVLQRYHRPVATRERLRLAHEEEETRAAT